MPSYDALRVEAVWRAQYVPPNLDQLLIQPLRTFYKLGADAIGAPGDNNHLYGRHRSANWDRTSSYCTNPSYGTTDGRDKQGDQDWYRAVDVGITGPPLYDACRRLDVAVRAGLLPGVAEWFGTFDGKTVVGWYEGHASSSDSSHLTHCHVGLWNQYANDPATLRVVLAVLTGVGMANPYTLDNLDRWLSAVLTNADNVTGVKDPQGKVSSYPNYLHVPIPTTGGGSGASGPVDLTDAAVARVADAVVDEQHDRLAD